MKVKQFNASFKKSQHYTETDLQGLHNAVLYKLVTVCYMKNVLTITENGIDSSSKYRANCMLMVAGLTTRTVGVDALAIHVQRI